MKVLFEIWMQDDNRARSCYKLETEGSRKYIEALLILLQSEQAQSLKIVKVT